MKKYISLFFLFCALACMAQSVKGRRVFRYRVELSDKKGTPYSVERPEQFLSQKSLARRAKLNIKVDEQDLPLSPIYLQELQALGARIFNQSKWNNTVQVELTDTLLAAKLRQLKSVRAVTLVCDIPVRTPPIVSPKIVDAGTAAASANHYGQGRTQVEMINAHQLHNAGFRGDGGSD